MDRLSEISSEEDDDFGDSSNPNSLEKDEGKLQTKKLVSHSCVTSSSSSKYSRIIFYPFMIAVLCTALYALNTTNKIENGAKITNLVDYLKKNFPSQDEEVWSILGAQLTDFMSDENVAPLVLVMVYDDDGNTVKLLASAVSSGAVQLKHFDDECGDTDKHKLAASHPALKKGYLLEVQLSRIKMCKKLIIYDVQEMVPSAASDLHSLLDPDYANVQSAVYVFTFKAPKNFKGNIYKMVGNILEKRWSTELDSDTIEPLLSRLVNFVKIVPEPEL